MYRFVRFLLFLFPPEKAHHVAVFFGRFLAGPFKWLLRELYGFEDERLKQNVFGLEFKNPFGAAAGFDKFGHLINVLPHVGFGFMEVGTVTPKAQKGNPQPRLFRLPKDKAVINRMGFNNHGVRYLVKQLKKRNVDGFLIAGNIGKNKVTPNAKAVSDYEKCFDALFSHVDFFVVNVSSPNTPNLRALQDKKPLTKLLKSLRERNAAMPFPKPILLKVAPDLTEGQLDDIVAVVKETGLDGVIATNTTISREGLKTSAKKVEAMGAGGLSGPVLRERSTEVIRYLYKKSKGAFPIVGVGGITTAEDAYEKIRAGATLVQAYTGIVYEGPAMASQINRGLARLLKRDKFKSISDAVGVDA